MDQLTNLETFTENQRAFIEHYALTGKSAESARKAGYAVKTASATASLLLRKENIREAIARERERIAGGVTPDNIKERLWHATDEKGKGSTHAARVTALKTLADLEGMGKTDKALDVLERLRSIEIVFVDGKGKAMGSLPNLLA